jgi:DUF971 family protein
MPEISTSPRPTELRVSADKTPTDGQFQQWRAFRTAGRDASRAFAFGRSAGAFGRQRKLVPGKRNVAIARLVPTGNYAVRIAFDDGHDTGIFTWSFFQELGRHLPDRIASYEAELKEKGLSRDR